MKSGTGGGVTARYLPPPPLLSPKSIRLQAKHFSCTHKRAPPGDKPCANRFPYTHGCTSLYSPIQPDTDFLGVRSRVAPPPLGVRYTGCQGKFYIGMGAG